MSCYLVSFLLSFFLSSYRTQLPSLCSAALLTSAAREPSVLVSDTNRHRQIKKHHSPINSPCSSLPGCDWTGIELRKRVGDWKWERESGWWSGGVGGTAGPTALHGGPRGPAVCRSPWHTSQLRWNTALLYCFDIKSAYLQQLHTFQSHCRIIYLIIYCICGG